MLDIMRKHAKNWVMKLLLGIIIVVFIFYFGSMRDSDRTDKIAIFDGKAISNADFQREYQNLIDLYRNRFGGNLNEEMIKGLKLKEQATDNLIRQAIILAKADELNLRVSDEELRNSILSHPAFQRNGVFDQHVYENTLRQNKMTPENFETMQRKVVITGKIQDLIISGVHVSDREVLDIYRMQKEKINVKYLKLSSKEYRSEVKPIRQALEAYFKEHSNEFRMPEQIQVKYVSFLAADYSANIKVADEDIKEYYERNKQGLSNKGGKQPSLADVSDKIAVALRQIAGMSRAAEEARKAREVIYQQENFDAYASSKGLRVQTSALFAAGSIPQEFRSLTDFSKNVFTLQKSELSRVLSDEKGYYLFQVASRKPSYLPDIKEAEKEVRYERLGPEECDILLVAYGTAARICFTARQLGEEKGWKIGLLRPITLYPFPEKAIAEAAAKAKAVLTVELSYGQMVEDVRLSICGLTDVHFYGRTGGVVPDQLQIMDQIRRILPRRSGPIKSGIERVEVAK